MSDFSTPDSPTRAVGRLPEKTVVALLQSLQKIAGEHAQAAFEGFAASLDERLLDYQEKASSDKEQRQLQEAIRLLRHNQLEVSERFAARVGEGFLLFRKKKLDTRAGQEKYEKNMLTLVDDADLEENIALSSIANRVEERFGESLWFLNQRMSVLNDGQKVRENNNPLSPIQFCESLRRALAPLSLPTKVKIIAYKIFDAELSSRFGSLVDESNRYLAHKGILPNLSHMGVGQNAAPAEAEAPADGASETPEAPLAEQQQSPAAAAPEAGGAGVSASAGQYQDGLIQAIRTLQSHLSPGGGSAAAPAPRSAPAGMQPSARSAAPTGSAAVPSAEVGQPVYSNQQLVSALQVLQTEALSASAGAASVPDGAGGGVTPQSIAMVGQQLVHQLREESPDGEVDSDDMHTIELVGMLFEYMLSDEQLPDSVKAILSYLHTPFLKMAFLDASFFEKSEHPARLLLNSLAEAGTRWVSNDGSSQHDMYAKIKQTVSRVLEDFENDVRLFAEVLLDFSAYVKKIARRQDLMEKRAMEKVQGEEKLREVKVRVNREIRTRTDGRELPSAVLLLLLQPWSDYLSFVLLRYGDGSDSWKGALRVVDDLLWSIDSKSVSKDKARQMEVMDDLLDGIEQGFSTIGYDQAKGKKLVEAVVSLQKMAMQSRAPAPAPARMRTQLEDEARQKAGADEGEEKAATPEEKKMVEHLKMIEFGTWFEFEGGKRLKVAWYNSKTMHYMLVDQMGKKVAMQSGLHLARAMLAGKARVIAGSSKPFFDRALENILENLNARAEAKQPEGQNG